MSNPSFSNIDLWLFELAEGNLSPKQIEQLEMFLLQHPELDVDRDVWEMAKIQKEQFHYPNQEKLERRRPVGMYVTAASVFLFLVVSTTLWLWLDSNPTIQYTRELGDDPTRVFVKTVYVDQSGEIVGPSSSNGSDQTHTTDLVVNSGINAPIHQSEMHNSLADINGSQQSVLNTSTTSTGELSNEVLATQVDVLETISAPLISNQSNQERQLIALSQIDDYRDVAEQLLSADQTQDITTNNSASSVEEITSVDPENSDLQRQETEVTSEEDGTNTRGVNNSHAMYSSDYHNSFKSRMQTLGRKIQRMMDNPVALRNFKDPHYHVPGMSPMDISFSSAGTMLATRIQSTSRLQWFGQENQLLTNQLSADGYAYGLRGGVGLQLNHSYYGDGSINDASAAFTYSPKFSISRKVSLEPSLRFKMGTKSLTASKVAETEMVEMERGNAYDFYPEQTPIGKTLWYKDLGLGVMVNTEWFFAGVQLDNLFRHEDNIYQVDIQDPQRANYHFVGTVGTDWVSKKENLGLSPYIVYQNYGRLNEAWAGMNVRWNWLTMGAALSTGMEPAASLGIKFEQFAMTYNVDYTHSSMTGIKNLSHQLSLRFITKPSRVGKRLLNL